MKNCRRGPLCPILPYHKCSESAAISIFWLRWCYLENWKSDFTRLNCDNLTLQGWHLNDLSTKRDPDWISTPPVKDCFLHTNFSSPVWVRKCVLRWTASEKLLLQWWQACDFSPVCVRKCVLRPLATEKLLVQWGQAYGFSPVWIRVCALSWPAWEKLLVQCWQAYGFSPVWVRKCVLRPPASENLLMQCGHSYGLSPVWVRKCVLRLTHYENILMQSGHE